MSVFALALLPLVSASAARAEAPAQKPERLDRQVHVTLDYLLYLPADYDKQDSWPLVLFLHGAGERGDDLDLVKKHGPPKLIEEGRSFPAIVVSPQCPRDRFWPVMTMELTALLDDVAAKHKVDVDRVYVTGLSMGGFGTWSLAAYTPERFAAIIPICGGGEPIAARRLNNMPTWVFHGAKDPVVPLARSEQMVDAIKKTNDKLKFTVYPDAMHDSWTETYNNPAVFEWLFAQKRSPAQE
jgi:predicted peptidase